MRKIKTYVITAAALCGLLVIGSLIRSSGSQVKGAYSTPVTVMNTISAPALGADVEKLARVPYQSNSVNAGCVAGSCSYSFSAPPAGFRLVAENLTGKLRTSTAATGAAVGDIEDNTLIAIASFIAPLGEMDGSLSQAVVSLPMKAYFDSSHGSPFVAVNSRWNVGAFVLTGYLENCSITGCPAIQH